MHRADRRNEPVSLLLLDVDHFKHFNDSFGHAAGYQILCYLGEVLRHNTRGADIVARYGGEEFAVLLPGTGTPEATRCADNLRQMASRMSIAWEGRVLPQLTVSVGVSACPDDGRELNALINAADGALYRAKHSGRNRVFTVQQALTV
ncbi:MAG: GGDEF domain-containing protein [Betaproteobacteria bacterium]|nr:GGDEF domain-containing protein [Betaproteobacteria bacterium]